jgi:hypothetical protein
MRLDRVRRTCGVEIVQCVRDRLARDDLAGSPQQHLKQRGLLRRCGKNLFADLNLPRSGVECHVAGRQYRARRDGWAPQDRTASGEQLREHERFDDVIVGPGVKAGDAIIGLPAGRYGQYRHLVACLAQTAKPGDAVAIWQIEIEEQKIETGDRQRRACLCQSGCRIDRIPSSPETGDQ